MTAAEFVGLVTELIFFVVFAVTLVRAFWLRTVPSYEIAVFFGLIVAVQQVGNALDLLGLGASTFAQKFGVVLLPALPYLLIRIVDHFTRQPRWLRFGALGITAAVMAVALLAPTPLPVIITVLVVAWIVVGVAYASTRFVNEARAAIGVTSRRLASAAIGSGLLALALVVALLNVMAPDGTDVIGMATQLLAVACAVAYYAGFATPTWLRRAWQEPAVRDFLADSASLTREPDDGVAFRRMSELAAGVMGTQHALVGVSTADRSRLRWYGPFSEPSESPSDQWIAGKAFTTGKVILSRNPAVDDPEHADIYRESDAGTVLAAPMSAGEERYGVLVAYASRAPVFAYSDRDLITVLAQQAAGIVEARSLLREAAEVQAREVAARAKEDFLSAAAHDLRTPLSSMVLRAELLHKRLLREESPHAEAVAAVVHDAGRVTEFVEDLLDAARAEHGRLSSATEAVDLYALAREVAGAQAQGEHRIAVEGGSTWVIGDRRRLRQVLDNLLSNARKYSPGGEPIAVTVATTDGMACVGVRDRGIGISPEDLPNLFQRFNRGRNVDDRRFSGLGLGLYICRRIVEEHEGRIWAESVIGEGTTMRFEIPSSTEASGPPEAAHG